MPKLGLAYTLTVNEAGKRVYRAPAQTPVSFGWAEGEGA